MRSRYNVNSHVNADLNSEGLSIQRNSLPWWQYTLNRSETQGRGFNDLNRVLSLLIQNILRQMLHKVGSVFIRHTVRKYDSKELSAFAKVKRLKL
jgi:hypothetical protein